VPEPAFGAETPALQPLVHLNSVWFQITGLKCNLECTHCLVDSSPANDSMAFLDRAMVWDRLAEAEKLGVKEIYFTGGEPFLHKEILTILEDALQIAPVTVLTNGTLVTERTAARLGALAAASRYSLEIRVSLDHPDPGRNDAVRGPGAHAKALRAVLLLEKAGLAPILTATEYLFEDGGAGMFDAFLALLREHGVRRPRLKIIPVFHIGKLHDRDEPGPVTPAMLEGADPFLLQCSETRVVAADGVYACPILVGKPVARLGTRTLAESLRPVSLAHPACATCYSTGMTCGNLGAPQ